MSWLILIPVAVFAAFLLFVWWRLIRVPRWGHRWLEIVSAIVLALLGAAVFAGFDAWGGAFSPAAMRPIVWVGAVFLAMCWYLFLGLALAWLAAGLVAVVGWRKGGDPVGRRRLARVASPVVAALAALTTAYGVFSAANPRVTEHTVTVPGLPSDLDGMRIALITDIHAGAVRSADFTRLVVDRTNAAHPDVVVIAGDLVDGMADRYGPEIAPLADLQAPLGVFATTGNHEMFRDTGSWIKEFESVGLRMLNNSNVTVTKGSASLVLAGVHDYSGQGPFQPDPEAALAGTSAQDVIIYAAHQPRQAYAVAGRGVDLQLSGHTHGGQMWPIGYLVPLQQPMVSGYAVLGDVPTLTSRGAGAWGPPVRVGAAPEIPVITLRAG